MREAELLAPSRTIPVAENPHTGTIVTVEYRPNETEHLVADPVLQREARRTSIRKLATVAGLSEKTVKAARRGQQLRKSTVDKLTRALKSLRMFGFISYCCLLLVSPRIISMIWLAC
jgi:hypothetical protein